MYVCAYKATLDLQFTGNAHVKYISTLLLMCKQLLHIMYLSETLIIFLPFQKYLL